VRVLFVFSTGQLGGAELAVLTALRHRPSDVVGHAVLLSPGALEQELAAVGLATSVAPLSRPTLSARRRLVRTLSGELASFAPDVVLAVGNKAALTSLLPSRRRKVPLVWHKVDFWYDRRGAGLLARQCQMVIAPSAAAGEAVPKHRLRIIHPPVRLPADLQSAASRPPATVGSIGRLEPRKGHHRVIEAAGRLRGAFPDIEVVIAGATVPYAPGYDAQLKAAAEAAGMADRLELLGHVDRIEEVLQRLTLLVSASYRDRRGRGGEALGLALAEASWSGLPVVSTRSGGTNEVVVDGGTGCLVPPESPEHLADAMAHFLGDPRAAAAAARAGAAFARERFSPRRSSQELFSALRECADPRRR
jgi:glycosyltransferase involved in cell wall biosynthesis